MRICIVTCGFKIITIYGDEIENTYVGHVVTTPQKLPSCRLIVTLS